MKISTLLALFIAVPQLALAQSDTELDYIKTLTLPNIFYSKSKAVYVMPPKQVFYGAVAGVSVRSDSQYISFVGDTSAHRTIPGHSEKGFSALNIGPTQAIYTYHFRSGTLKKIMDVPAKILDCSFPVGSQDLYLSVEQNDQIINLLISPESGQRRQFIPPKFEFDSSYPRFIPTQNVVVYTDQDANENLILHVLSLQNTGTRTFRFGKIPQYFVNSSASNLYVNIDRTQFEVNLQNGQLTEMPQGFKIPYQEPPYEVIPGESVAIGDPSIFRRRWSDEQPSTTENLKPLIIARDGLDGKSTFDGKFVYYTDRSGLFLADLVNISLPDLTELAKETVKRETMSRAKQVGTGIMIYTADYDDHLPLANDWQGSVHPYLKNKSLTNGFTYLMNGQNVSEIENITQTIMGMIETPFGTAIVRGDSSVIWKDRPKRIENQANLKF
ncbi:hypothetical protein CCB80_12930 [Armatimonadetes bacterium Uphvl-Ar1]|nr:hypothetical protein CCB80_12930 [Armatimonadetes bacterium Uphvl-Ar1]